MNLIKDVDGMQQSDIQKMEQEFDRVANYLQRKEQKRLQDRIKLHTALRKKVAPRSIRLLSQVEKHLRHYWNLYIELLQHTIEESSATKHP